MKHVNSYKLYESDIEQADTILSWILSDTESGIENVMSSIEKGCDVNIRNSIDATPLMAAASMGNFKLIKFLLEHGADANAVDIRNSAAINKAVRLNHEHKVNQEKIFNILIKYGADINNQKIDADGWTALHEAAYFGLVDTIVLLLNLGADPTIKNTYNENFIELANYNTGKWLCQYKIQKPLIERYPSLYTSFEKNNMLHYQTKRNKKFDYLRTSYDLGLLQ
jgi:hypothetical protein